MNDARSSSSPEGAGQPERGSCGWSAGAAFQAIVPSAETAFGDKDVLVIGRVSRGDDLDALLQCLLGIAAQSTGRMLRDPMPYTHTCRSSGSSRQLDGSAAAAQTGQVLVRVRVLDDIHERAHRNVAQRRLLGAEQRPVERSDELIKERDEGLALGLEHVADGIDDVGHERLLLTQFILQQVSVL